MEVGKIAKSDDTRINDEITASSCRLIGVDGSQLGLFAIRDAQRVADDQGLDLVEIAPNAEPPVCKVMDYGKFKFEQAKREYIVEPIFKSEGEISLFSLLLNLMRLDAMG